MTVCEPLSPDERRLLLLLARQAIDAAVNRCPAPVLVMQDFSPALQAPGASFVTLTQAGALRGCIGTLEACLPLVQDVCAHAVSAAVDDFRFYPVRPHDVPFLKIEISRLTPLVEVFFQEPEELLSQLRPGVDGVVLRDGLNRSTFLPQVWEKIGSCEGFLNHLALKMGAPPDYWRHKKLQVFTYQVEEFHE